MTQEDIRELQYRDLSSRLPYGVMVEVDGYGTSELKGIDNRTVSTERGINYPWMLARPYLRSLSSLSEEEQIELGKLIGTAAYNMIKGHMSHLDALLVHVYKNHIDLFELIPKGLALEAPEGMYDLKSQKNRKI